MNFIITYDISREGEGATTAEEFEKILTDHKFQKQHNNQSTYFGSYASKMDLSRDLFNAISSMRLKLRKHDHVTIYYPFVSSNKPEIGKHELKKEGSEILNYPSWE